MKETYRYHEKKEGSTLLKQGQAGLLRWHISADIEGKEEPSFRRGTSDRVQSKDKTLRLESGVLAG